MIPARLGAGIVLLAGWHSLLMLAGRAEGVGLATTIMLAAVLGWALARARAHLPAIRLTGALLGMAVAGLTGIVLVEIGAMVAALLLCVVPRPRWSMMSLAPLALPILPTLDVLLAWPLRRAAALLTVAMLRMNGVGVGLEGVALQWHGQQLLFDGPCSGVRMLWAMLILASLIALVRQLSAMRFALLLAMAVMIAIIGNALRAASLFYLENGFLPALANPFAHEALGLAAFSLMAAGTVAFFARSARALS